MVKPTRLLLVVLAALLSVACASAPETRLLLIGNSYSTANDLPGVVRDLAASTGRRIEVVARAPGGWWLRDHVNSSETLDAIAEGEFDFVVLQEQSMVPADRRLAERESVPAARDLGIRVNQSGARPVLFMTWGHRRGSREVGHASYEPMQVAIAESYDRLADVTIGELAPVGAAWWMSLAERPDIILYQPDGSHPAVAGTYLAAAVIAGVVVDVDPTEFEADLMLTADQAAALRSFAARALTGERPWD